MKQLIAACTLCLAGAVTLAGDSAAPGARYKIAFASFAPLNSDIFIARGDGGNARPLLANPWQEYNAALSADGNWVSFTSEKEGTADIYRMHPDGSGMEALVTGPAFDDQGALSPDGSKLAFVSDRGGQADIWVLDLRTRTLLNVSHHPGGDFRPAWSPDGQWLAFSSDRDSAQPKFSFVTLHSTAIYLVRPDGKDLRRLGSTSAFAGSPCWNKEGTHVLFYETDADNVNKVTSPRRLRGSTQIASIAIADGAYRQLSSGPGEKWSPKALPSGQVGYVSGGPDAGVELLAGPAGARGEMRSPSWSADGRTLVFHRETASGWPPHQHWPGADPRFALLRTGVFPSWQPDGRRLILNDKTAGNLHNDIVSVNADGSGMALLFHDEKRSALAPAVSPSGKHIAFGLGGFFQTIKGKAVADIALINADGSGLTILTDGSGNFGLPSWSPDGRQLVYRGAGGEKEGLFIMDIASRAVRHLPGTGASDNFPAWSPGGDRISFTSKRDGDYEIYSIRPDGSQLRRLTSSPGNDAHNSWSPDGLWIAFTSARGGFKDESVLHPFNPQPQGDLYVMRADGSELRRLTGNQFEEGTPSFARDASRYAD